MADSLLKTVKELLYDKCEFSLTNLKVHTESKEYGACSFKLNGKIVEYRDSKITPTKTGQFVTIWKRNNQGITAPFDLSDGFDFVVITAKSGENLGQFIFPIAVLTENGIVSQNGKSGKRGIRVYPSWDKVTSKQAEKTQHWQIAYFVLLNSSGQDLGLIKKLFNGKME